MAEILLKRQPGKSYTAALLNSDTAEIPGSLVISGTAIAGTEVLRVQGETRIEGVLHGSLNGTGLIVGVAGAGASTGSALQIGAFTTAQRGNLASATGTAGMLIYNSTLTRFQYSNGLRWGDTASNNFQAITAPSTANDSTQGYDIGSLWVDTLTNIMYCCTSNSVGAASWTSISAIPTGKVVWVDSVNGNNSTGIRGRIDRPFLTIQAAITAASAGDTVYVLPGTYAEALTCKDDVSVIGIDRFRVTVSTAAAGTLVTMADRMSLSQVTLLAQPVAGTAVCVKFTGTSASTSNLFRVAVSPSSTGNVTGVQMTGSGTTPLGRATARSCQLIGFGTGYASESSGSAFVRFYDCVLSGPTGAKVTGTGTIYLCGGELSGTTYAADVSVNGTIQIDHNVSVEGTINNLGTMMGLGSAYPIDNRSASSDPTVNDDQTKGYGAESHWINTTTGKTWICSSGATGAAVWHIATITNPAPNGYIEPNFDTPNPNNPLTYCFENISAYTTLGAGAAGNQIDFMRVWLPANRTITKFRYYIVSGADSVIQAHIGLYDQASILSEIDVPNNRLVNLSDTPPTGTTGFRDIACGATATTITVASNGVALPTGTINVVSTAGFPASGNILVTTNTGVTTVAYTGVTGTTFTGCTGGTGTMATGGSVSTVGYTIPNTGFYWIALQATNTNLKFRITGTYAAGQVPRRERTVAGLPNPAGATTAPASAVPLILAVE